MKTGEPDHNEIILLADLSPRYHDKEKYPVQVQYSLKRDKGAFYYQDNILRSTKFIQEKCIVMNSGTKHHREELYDQEEVPLKNLLELIERTKEGCVFSFEFDPAEDVWRGNLERKINGAVYNTIVYSHWRVTLALDLIHYTYEYDSYSYDDTST